MERINAVVNKEISRRGEIYKILPDGSIGVELGVAEGFFSEQLLSSGAFKFLYSIDMYAGDRGHDIGQYVRALRRLRNYRDKNSILKMKFNEALAFFDDESLDFIYVDGYAHTGQDGGRTLSSWYPKLKAGGIFSGHDYSEKFPMVVREVHAFASRVARSIYIIDDKQDSEWNHGCPSWYLIK